MQFCVPLGTLWQITHWKCSVLPIIFLLNNPCVLRVALPKSIGYSWKKKKTPHFIIFQHFNHPSNQSIVIRLSFISLILVNQPFIHCSSFCIYKHFKFLLNNISFLIFSWNLYSIISSNSLWLQDHRFSYNLLKIHFSFWMNCHK